MNPELMKAFGFGKAVEAVAAGKCPFCAKPVNSASFRDTLSAKEFKISGLCQTCQDEMFGGAPE